MGLGQKILGSAHGWAHDNSGGLILRPRLYEFGAAVGYLGFRRRIYDGLVALGGARPGDRVLDVGCGTGYLTRRVARAVGSAGGVVGVDPSRPMLDHATKLAPPTCTFVCAGAEAIPLPAEGFDLVVSSLAVHHIPETLRAAAFAEMFRVLRPGGRLLVADFRPPRNRMANSLIGALSGHAMQHNPVEQLATLATGAGFTVTGSGNRRPWLHYLQATRPSR